MRVELQLGATKNSFALKLNGNNTSEVVATDLRQMAEFFTELADQLEGK